MIQRTYKTETDSLTEHTYGYQRGRVAERIVREFRVDMYTLLYLEAITKRDLLYSTKNSAQYYLTT